MITSHNIFPTLAARGRVPKMLPSQWVDQRRRLCATDPTFSVQIAKNAIEIFQYNHHNWQLHVFSSSIFYHLLWLKCDKSWLGSFFAIFFKLIIFVTKFHDMLFLHLFHWNIVCLFWYKKVSWSVACSANILCIGYMNWVGHLSPDSS